jgi:cell division transport system permease protein
MTFKLAFKHIFSKPFLSIFTLIGVIFALTVLGSFWTVVENLERVRVQSSGTNPQTARAPALTLFVDAGAPKEDIQDLKNKLQADTRFGSMQLVQGVDALKVMEEQFGETLGHLFSGDSFPVTIKLTFANATMNQSEYIGILNEMRALPHVLDLDDGQNLTLSPKVAVTNRVFSWANSLLLIVFLIVSLLVSHLVRIAFETLRPEVETMKVLGASKFWIFKPLFIEGFLFGLVGSLFALLTLSIVVNGFLPKYAAVLLPQGLEIRALSFSSSLGLVGLSLLASVIGAFFTWPLIQRSPKEI